MPRAFSVLYRFGLALQKAQHTLLGGIRLRQHRHRGLLKDLRLGQLRAFRREVGVLDAALRSCRVDRDVRQVRDRVIEPV